MIRPLARARRRQVLARLVASAAAPSSLGSRLASGHGAWLSRGPLAAAPLLADVAPARAQARYPTQPVHLVIPYPPGGTTDIVGRRFGELMSRALGQPVVVENRPGAATNIGNEYAARASPDGYTLLLGSTGLASNLVFGPLPAVDPVRSLDSISLVCRIPFMVAANPRAPFSNGREFIAAARAKPGTITVSSAQLDFYIEVMKDRAGIDILHVPYRGGAPATTDAIGGQVDAVFALSPVLLPHIQAGRLKPIAVQLDRRLEALPDTPTFDESGARGLDITTWYALFAPKGTPAAVRERLHEEAVRVTGDPQFVKTMSAAGVRVESSTPQALDALVRNELSFWREFASAKPNLQHATPR